MVIDAHTDRGMLVWEDVGETGTLLLEVNILISKVLGCKLKGYSLNYVVYLQGFTLRFIL